MDEAPRLQKNGVGFFFSPSGACIFFFSPYASRSLTVDGESHSSGQVRVQVVVIHPLAIVHAAVGALDRLEDQEAVLASDGFVLGVGGQRQTVELNTALSHGGRAGGEKTRTSLEKSNSGCGFPSVSHFMVTVSPSLTGSALTRTKVAVSEGSAWMENR